MKLCCELFGVSKSGFYKWKNSLVGPRKSRDEELIKKIEKEFENSKKTYGSPRITRKLKLGGETVSENKVAKLMRENDLNATKKAAFRPKTTINNPSDKKAERVFKIEGPGPKKINEVWGSDLTYIPTEKGFCYLVVVEDLFNREIVGWDLSETMEAENTKAALTNALKRAQGDLSGLIFHSDQGTQYCSKSVRERIHLTGLIQSMSRRGNCYDNAYIESFFSTMKRELEKTVFKDIEEARKYIFEYIEGWYNTERLHSSLGYLSPRDYVKENCLAA